MPITSLEVIDDSERHAGHVGWRPGGGTHFKVVIVSPAFKGRSRLECQRMVNEVLKEELQGAIHALSIRASAA